MESKCHEVFEKVAYIYNNAHVLGRVWQGIEPERRQESIDKLRLKVAILKEKKVVRDRDSNDVFNFLDTLEQYNKGVGTIHDIRGKLDNLTGELAIHAIADCECMRPLK